MYSHNQQNTQYTAQEYTKIHEVNTLHDMSTYLTDSRIRRPNDAKAKTFATFALPPALQSMQARLIRILRLLYYQSALFLEGTRVVGD